jgi:hypothetical protein
MTTESFRFGRINNFGAIGNLQTLASNAASNPQRQITRNGNNLVQLIRESYQGPNYLYMRFATEDVEQYTSINPSTGNDSTQTYDPRYVSDIILYDTGDYGYVSRNGGNPDDVFDLITNSAVSYTSGLSIPSSVIDHYYNNYDMLKRVKFTDVTTQNISSNMGQSVDEATFSADSNSTSDLKNIQIVSQLHNQTTTNTQTIKVRNRNSNNRTISRNNYVSTYYSDNNSAQVRSTTINNAVSPVISRLP